MQERRVRERYLVNGMWGPKKVFCFVFLSNQIMEDVLKALDETNILEKEE